MAEAPRNLDTPAARADQVKADARQASDNKDDVSAQKEFKVLDVRTDDVTLELSDGRVIVATLKDGIELDSLKRGTMVAITYDGLDRSDAPKDAVVSRVIPKD